MNTKTPMQSKTTAAKPTAPASKASAPKAAPMAKSTAATPAKPAAAPAAKKPNPNTEFAQDMVKLDDVAIISDVLKTEKALIGRYGTAWTEISCEKLRNLVKTNMAECACDQFDAFNYMSQRNLYPTETAPANKVTQAKQKYAEKKAKMKK